MPVCFVEATDKLSNRYIMLLTYR